MSTRKTTFNLTPLFIIWSLVFIIVAVQTTDTSWLWWAAAPWLVTWTFGLVVLVVSLVIIGGIYISGNPITVTTPGKGTRTVQRGR